MTATTQQIYDARRCCSEGRFHAAASMLLEAFRKDPNNGAVALELGVVMRAVGDPSGALEYLTRAYFADPSNPQIVAELVLTHHDLGSHDEASTLLVRSLNIGLEGEALARYLQSAA